MRSGADVGVWGAVSVLGSQKSSKGVKGRGQGFVKFFYCNHVYMNLASCTGTLSCWNIFSPLNVNSNAAGYKENCVL